MMQPLPIATKYKKKIIKLTIGPKRITCNSYSRVYFLNLIVKTTTTTTKNQVNDLYEVILKHKKKETF